MRNARKLLRLPLRSAGIKKAGAGNALFLEQPQPKETPMRVDIFRRTESDGRHSHLAVPEGKVLPEEVTDYEWHDEQRGTELDETAARWPQYGIEQPGQQIKAKGYAITSLNETTSN